MSTKALVVAAVAVALVGGYAALRYTGVWDTHGCCRAGSGAPEGASEPGTTPPADSPQDDQALAAAQRNCPVMPDTKLGEMGEPVKVMVKDKSGAEQTVFVCCKGCKRKALADPEATLARVAEFKAAAPK